MAKKKEVSASPFVPVEEQPYPIPENWCWTRFDSVADGFQYGYTEKATYDKVGPHFIRITDIGNGIIDDRSAPYCKIDAATYPKYKIHKNDIFIARMGSVGENGIALEDIDAVFASYLIRVIPKISATLVIDYLQSPMYWGQITDKSQGTTRLNVNANVLKKILFPLPPLPEQQRIVSRIESLFAKLDEAKEKAQAVVDSFELRKSAILHMAFTGELAGISDGITTPLESIVEAIRIGPFGSALHKEDYITGGIPIVNPKHIINQQIMPENNVTITEEKADELTAYRLKTGDIIMGRRGEMGRSAPVTEKENGWLCGTGSLIIKLQDGYSGAFYSQIIASHSSIQYLEENCVGSTMKNLNEKVIKGLPVPNYTKEQQKIIVAILNSLLKKEQQAKEAAEAALKQIAAMKKVILARAFRGELGTNDPAEESAAELLKTTLHA
jgi:type I restriction enzyme S subunit